MCVSPLQATPNLGAVAAATGAPAPAQTDHSAHTTSQTAPEAAAAAVAGATSQGGGLTGAVDGAAMVQTADILSALTDILESLQKLIELMGGFSGTGAVGAATGAGAAAAPMAGCDDAAMAGCGDHGAAAAPSVDHSAHTTTQDPARVSKVLGASGVIAIDALAAIDKFVFADAAPMSSNPNALNMDAMEKMVFGAAQPVGNVNISNVIASAPILQPVATRSTSSQPIAAAAPAPLASPTSLGPIPATSGSMQTQVLNEINRIRAAYGLQPVKFNAILDQVAVQHNAAQIQSRTMGHVGTNDGTPGDRIRNAGFTGHWGENVAVGQNNVSDLFWQADAADGSHQSWMGSPTHKANILDPNFNAVGIAYGTTADGYAFWSLELGQA